VFFPDHDEQGGTIWQIHTFGRNLDLWGKVPMGFQIDMAVIQRDNSQLEIAVKSGKWPLFWL